MDWIFLPDKSAPHEVPLLVDTPYDPSVESFDNLSGISDGNLESHLMSLDTRECARLLQRGCFFGLMAEISGSVIKPADFRSSDSQAVLRINRNIVNNVLDSIQIRRQHAGEMLAKAIRRSNVFDAVLIERPSVSLEADKASLISLSVKLLIELLAKAPKLTTFTGTTPTSPAARLVVEIAESNGWCTKQAINHFLSYDYTMLNYLAAMKRGPSTRHKACREGGGQMCVAYELPKGYITRHVKDPCKTCQPSGGSTDDLMGPDPKQVRRIIEAGQIPILRLNIAPGQRYSITVETLEFSTEYFAISHVWSDGLGNEHSNQIRRCQVARLHDILRKAMVWRDRDRQPFWAKGGRDDHWERDNSFRDRHIFFWLDTLCIPVNPQNDKNLGEIKMKAIRHITPIYNGAVAVVVLDSEVESMQFGLNPNDGKQRLPDHVMAAHVLSGKWTTRAWTLQEGALARQCYYYVQGTFQAVPQKRFEELDGWHDKLAKFVRSSGRHGKTAIDREVIRLEDRWPALLEEMLQEGRKTALRTSSPESEMQGLRAKFFMHCWNELLMRSTSKAPDKLLILGSMMDFNTANVKGYERLAAIIRSCDEIPLSLLYAPAERLNGLTTMEDAWIPKTIGGRLLHSDGSLKRTILGQRYLHMSFEDSTKIKIWKTDTNVPWESNLLQFDNPTTNNSIFIEQVDERVNESPEFRQKREEAFRAAKGHCIIMDPSAGTETAQGYYAFGALLTIQRSESATRNIRMVEQNARYEDLYLQFDSVVTFQTPKQWQAKNPGQSADTQPGFHRVNVELVTSPAYKRRLFLATSPKWHPKPFTHLPLLRQVYNMKFMEFMSWMFPCTGIIMSVTGLVLYLTVGGRLIGLHEALIALGILIFFVPYVIRRPFKKRKWERWVAAFADEGPGAAAGRRVGDSGVGAPRELKG